MTLTVSYRVLLLGALLLSLLTQASHQESDLFDGDHASDSLNNDMDDPYRSICPIGDLDSHGSAMCDYLPWQAIALNDHSDATHMWDGDLFSYFELGEHEESGAEGPSVNHLVMPAKDNDAGEIIYWRAEYDCFSAAQWQHRYLNNQVKFMFARLTRSWPDYVSRDVLETHFNRLNKWFNINTSIVARLINNDEAIWEHALIYCMLDVNRAKVSRKSPAKKEKMVTISWLAKPILSSEKDAILTRLASHWGFDKVKEVHPRANRYANKYGPITSPEPLLDMNDEETFKRAADMIYCKSAPYGHRMVGAGENDLLHQYPAPYNVEATKNEQVRSSSRRLKVGALRYNSGHSWLRGVSYEDIAFIQDTVKDCWGGGLASRVTLACFLNVNDFLESHPTYIERIKKGDKGAAEYIARLTRFKSTYRHYKERLLPAEWYVEPPIPEEVKNALVGDVFAVSEP